MRRAGFEDLTSSTSNRTSRGLERRVSAGSTFPSSAPAYRFPPPRPNYTPAWAMEYDNSPFHYSPSPLAFQQYYDADGRPLRVLPPPRPDYQERQYRPQGQNEQYPHGQPPFQQLELGTSGARQKPVGGAHRPGPAYPGESVYERPGNAIGNPNLVPLTSNRLERNLGPVINEVKSNDHPSRPESEGKAKFKPTMSGGNAPADGSDGPSRPREPVRKLPNYVQVADAYIFQQTIDERLRRIGVTMAREDGLRLAGVQWIDQVRKALKLPVRTFDTACIYYHKFRLVHGDNEYAYTDASAAALFTACKIEDTLKKSRDILCAAHNLRAPPRDHLSSDDPLFEQGSRTVIGHERLMLEASGFDFRSRHPQQLLIKLLKHYRHVKGSEVARAAYKMSLDLYRTFAPLKQGTAAMAMACLELAERLAAQQNSQSFDAETLKTFEQGYPRWGINRAQVMETMLDLLDVYNSYRSSTSLGPDVPLDDFLNVRIPLNEEMDRRKLPRYTEYVDVHPPTGSRFDEPPREANGLMNGTGSGRSSKNVSPKDASPGSGGSVPGSGSTGLTGPTSGGSGGMSGNAGVAGPPPAPGVRHRVGDRGREGTVRFILNPQREREERKVVGEYSREDREGIITWNPARGGGGGGMGRG